MPTTFGAEGRYRGVRPLSVGGMAELFLAVAQREAGFEKLVVVKRILPHLASDDEFVRMFLDEARLAAQLDHPNIAQVMDFGRDQDSYYYVMEYIHGLDVRALLKRVGGPLPLDVALALMAPVCAGLHYAHEKRDRSGQPLALVHRDVSPSNLFVSIDGGVKVLDFGIAKAATAARVTASGVLKGKIGYMSPEQARGDELDRRSDVFGLGIVLYQMVTGRRPFAEANYFKALNDVQRGRFARPREVSDGCPEALDELIVKAMAIDREDRFPTARDLALAVEEFALAHRVRASAAVLSDFMAPLREDVPYPDVQSSGVTETSVVKVPLEITQAASAGTDTTVWTKRRIRSAKNRVLLGVGVALPAAVFGGWYFGSHPEVDASARDAAPAVESVEVDTPIEPIDAPIDPKPPVAPTAAEPEASGVADSPAAAPPPVEAPEPTPRKRPRRKTKKSKRGSSSAGERPKDPKELLGGLAPPGE